MKRSFSLASAIPSLGTPRFVFVGAALVTIAACGAPTPGVGVIIPGGSSGSGSSSGGSVPAPFCAAGTDVAPGYTMYALACGQDTPSGLALSNGNIYWTQYDAAQNIMSVPVTGGTPTVVVSNQDYPWAIAADATNIYWTNYDNDGAVSGGDTTAGQVLQAPLGGGTVTTLATGLEDPYGIAVDADNVYFTTYGGGKVKKVPIGGGAVTILAQGLNAPCYIAVSGGNVYWANYGDGTVQMISTSGTAPGTPTTLATDLAGDNANGIAVSGGTVFYAASNDPGDIYSVSAAGGTPTAIASGQDDPWGLATDGTNVYWTDNDDPGDLVFVPIAGGTPTTLTSSLIDPTGIAVDSTGVYVTGDGGHIWRISKS
jgi:hypothetical protein